MSRKRTQVMKAGNGVYRQNGVTYEGTFHNVEKPAPTFYDNVSWLGNNIGSGVYNAASTTVAGVQHVGTGIGSAVTNTVGAIIPQSYKIGESVIAKYYKPDGKPNGLWYDAKITDLYTNGSYEVKYEDNGSYADLKNADIKKTGGKSRKHRKSHKHNKSRKNRKSRKQRK